LMRARLHRLESQSTRGMQCHLDERTKSDHVTLSNAIDVAEECMLHWELELAWVANWVRAWVHGQLGEGRETVEIYSGRPTCKAAHDDSV
jgi:hypothetical protein